MEDVQTHVHQSLPADIQFSNLLSLMMELSTGNVTLDKPTNDGYMFFG
jgi:hypothetical protein